MLASPHGRGMGRTARKDAMSYKRDCEAFVWTMAGYGVGLGTIRSFLRDAGIIQRAAEIDCSVSHEGMRADAKRRSSQAELRIQGNVHELGEISSANPASPGLWRVKTAGDPRGYCVRIFPPSIRNYQDAEGIGVPAQGYRASQMARMAR